MFLKTCFVMITISQDGCEKLLILIIEVRKEIMKLEKQKGSGITLNNAAFFQKNYSTIFHLSSQDLEITLKTTS